MLFCYCCCCRRGRHRQQLDGFLLVLLESTLIVKNEKTFRRNIRGGKMMSRKEKGVKSYASFSLKSITSQMEKKGKLRKHFCRGRDDLETPETVRDGNKRKALFAAHLS